MSPLAILGVVAAVSSSVMIGMFAVSVRTRNIGLVDVAWSILVGLAAVFAALASAGDAVHRAAVFAIGGLWSVRLATHLARRVGSEAEDGRYQAMRRGMGERLLPLFVFFQMQAFSVVLFAVPFVVASDARVRSPIAVLAALVVAGLAIAGEAIADAQLVRHRADPANRGITCRAGLWGWSRHPNYFFEWLHWFAYLPLSLGSPWAWASLVGPVMMGLFLYRVSGIPWVEAQAIRSRGDDYRAYQREVSAFFPLPPRRTVNP